MGRELRRERVRFPAPVPSGSSHPRPVPRRLGGGRTAAEPGTIEATSSARAVAKPVCVAELVALAVLNNLLASVGHVCYLGPPVGLEAPLLLVVLAAVLSVVIVPGAGAGTSTSNGWGARGEPARAAGAARARYESSADDDEDLGCAAFTIPSPLDFHGGVLTRSSSHRKVS